VPTPDLPAEGDCYELAFGQVLALHFSAEPMLVHGRPTLTRPPFCQYGHAWVEVGDLVLDPSGKAIPKALYYAVGKIDPALCVRYTAQQALKCSWKHKHYGPWEGVDAVP
jgi:hypothetical protein